jgi:CHAD domain-containing protein
MAIPIHVSSRVSSKSIGLELWMNRVLEEADSVQRTWDADAVHDLRVAIRRCRTMAEALSEVNPGPGWRKLKKASRQVFQTLGLLRDLQVEREWVQKLGTPGEPVRRHLLRVLSREIKFRREQAERALDRMDRKEWKKLARKLGAKAQFFPLESVVFQRLALGSLNEAVELYHRARKGRSRIAWHRLRIGLKEFRYIVENFLPHRYESWGEELKRMQDLLGEVHDLDVLRVEIRRRCMGIDPGAVAGWMDRIEKERRSRLDQLVARVGDKDSLWQSWRSGLQGGNSFRTVSLIEAQSA